MQSNESISQLNLKRISASVAHERSEVVSSTRSKRFRSLSASSCLYRDCAPSMTSSQTIRVIPNCLLSQPSIRRQMLTKQVNDNGGIQQPYDHPRCSLCLCRCASTHAAPSRIPSSFQPPVNPAAIISVPVIGSGRISCWISSSVHTGRGSSMTTSTSPAGKPAGRLTSSCPSSVI